MALKKTLRWLKRAVCEHSGRHTVHNFERLDDGSYIIRSQTTCMDCGKGVPGEGPPDHMISQLHGLNHQSIYDAPRPADS